MFDYHLHSNVSFDATGTPEEMAKSAVEKGLREICFTDHYDHGFLPTDNHRRYT